MSKWATLKQASSKQNTKLLLEETGVIVYLRPPSSAVVIEFAQVLDRVKSISESERQPDDINDDRNKAIRAMVVDSIVDSDGEPVFDNGDEILTSVPIGDLKTLIENTLTMAGVTTIKEDSSVTIIGSGEDEPKNVSGGALSLNDSTH